MDSIERWLFRCQVLNLFLALLLSSFGAESLSRSSDEESTEANKLQEALDRIIRFHLYVRSHLCYAVNAHLKPRLVGSVRRLTSVSGGQRSTDNDTGVEASVTVTLDDDRCEDGGGDSDEKQCLEDDVMSNADDDDDETGG